MHLKGTRTEKNLLLAYTGESNNRNFRTLDLDRKFYGLLPTVLA